mgnify:CR=1 FL=1
MSSLRKMVNEYKDDLREGITWVIFWKEGRSWESSHVYIVVNGGEEIIENEYKEELETILQKDPHAIALNGYIHGMFFEDATINHMIDAVKYYYEEWKSCSLENFIECYSEWSMELKEEKTQNIASNGIITQNIDKKTETEQKTDNVEYADFKQQKAEKNVNYQINENMAARAKSMMSFNDYKKGSATNEYRKLIDEASTIAEQQKSKVDSMYHEKIDYYFHLYARKLAQNLNGFHEIGTRCPSVMIAGGANFSVKKKERQMNAYRKNAQEYEEIQEILYKIKGIGMGGISSDNPKAMEKLKEKLFTLEQNQEQMKQVNAYYKKHKTLEGCSLLSEAEKKRLTSYIEKDYNAEKRPYNSFTLTNNNAKIKHTKQRIAELEKKDFLKGWKFESGEVVANKEVNRLQIVFDEKPEEELRAKLKLNGFKWSPSQKAWQRLLNQNAVRAVKRIEELAEIKV